MYKQLINHIRLKCLITNEEESETNEFQKKQNIQKRKYLINLFLLLRITNDNEFVDLQLYIVNYKKDISFRLN